MTGHTRGMDAFDIPRLRGLTHAYAFWAALVATVCLVASSRPAALRGRRR